MPFKGQARSFECNMVQKVHFRFHMATNGGKNTQKNCTKKIFMAQITTMVWSFTQSQTDILKCEVKWALGSITTNKGSGGDGIPVELFKSWKMMLWQCCTQNGSKFGKLSSAHRTGKSQFSFQSQRKAMPKNTQTTAHLHSSHMLLKKCSQFSKPGFSNM